MWNDVKKNSAVVPIYQQIEALASDRFLKALTIWQN